MSIHYDISRMVIQTEKEPYRLSQQWQAVENELKQDRYSEIERARLAFNIVDYITSEDLPWRLLITRAPQAMAKIAEETKIHKEYRTINGRKVGVVYSRQPLVLPKEINYSTHYESMRIVNGTKQKLSSDNLLDCLLAGDTITPLDGILFLQCKRVAIDIARLKKRNSNLDIQMKRIEVSDNFTGNVRMMASYRLS